MVLLVPLFIIRQKIERNFIPILMEDMCVFVDFRRSSPSKNRVMIYWKPYGEKFVRIRTYHRFGLECGLPDNLGRNENGIISTSKRGAVSTKKKNWIVLFFWLLIANFQLSFDVDWIIFASIDSGILKK